MNSLREEYGLRNFNRLTSGGLAADEARKDASPEGKGSICEGTSLQVAGKAVHRQTHFTTNPKEIDVDDYALSLYASLSQAYEPMNIRLKNERNQALRF
jgi:hypothetical protein